MYKIYFDTINSDKIENFCSPDYIFKDLGKNYFEILNNETNFYNDLEKSILREGFRNPILINYPKPRIFKKYSSDKFYFCEILGGSRLFIAQKYNMKIPAIISDFSDKEKDLELLDTEEKIKNKFKDKPEKIYFTEYGLKIEKNKNDYFFKLENNISKIKVDFYKNYLGKIKK